MDRQMDQQMDRTTRTRRHAALRVLAPVALALAVLGLGSGCRSHRTVEDEMTGFAQGAADAVRFRTFATDEPLELATHGPLAVEIDNFAGDVVVRADREVERTFVEVRRVATHGLGRWQESRSVLDEPSWTATLEPRTAGGETLVIATDTPNPEKHFHRMEILVVTPALDTVRVRTLDGDVTVIENQGTVDVETTRGDVRVMTPWPMTGPMTMVTSEGDIDYRIRGESKGYFDAATHGGLVRQRAEYGKWRAIDRENDHDRMLATLNDGTNPVILRTSDGDIRIAVVPVPTAVGPWIR